MIGMGTVCSKQMQVPIPQADKVCAIIVLFYPGRSFRDRLSEILAQFDCVVIVDNTPGRRRDRNFPNGVEQIINGKNIGIAAALNQGVRLALEMGATWVATFDQDSGLLPNYLDKVVSAAASHAPRPALVGCNYFIGTGHRARHLHRFFLPAVRSPVTLITSGTFMPAKFASDIGGFREEFFIDSVDHEFCLRAQAHGAAILMIAQPLMCHRIGEASSRAGSILSFQHTPQRRYYIARNTLMTVRRYWKRHPFWSAKQLCRLVAEWLSIITMESQKWEKHAFFGRGIHHGLVGKSGSLNDV